jgi:Ceramidase
MEPIPPIRFSRRELGLVLVVAAPLLYLMFVHGAPIPQDPAFHVFADTRTFLGLPHFANVVSNIGFLIAGAIGLTWCLRNPATAVVRSWTAFFAGVMLVCLGSGYYHSNPSDATLVWDRLPMTVAFMGLFAALSSEHFGPSWERRLLIPALGVGIASVLLWKISGDLRIYLWVQLAPFLAIAYAIMVCPGRYTHRHYLLYGVGLYVLAKAAELQDQGLLDFTAGAISGHSVKHLLAAAAPFCVYLMLKRRTPLQL